MDDFEEQVTLIVHRTNKADVQVTKPIAFRNMYAEMAKRGFVRPLVFNHQRFRKVDKQLKGTYTIRNVENNPITITARSLTKHFCDPDREPEPVDESLVRVGRDWSLPQTIPARATLDRTLAVQRADFGSDVCAVTEESLGTTTDDLEVRISASFETREFGPAGYEITDPASLDTLRKVVNENLVDDTDEFTQDELTNLLLQRRIEHLPIINAPISGALGEGDTGSTAVQLIGKTCDPETPSNVPGVVCQRTDRFRLVPGLIRNALKGDLILVPGCEPLGQILRKVSPAQAFVHEGIMTRNYVEVAHSTAIPLRMFRGVEDNFEFDEKLLKYAWPGAQVETVSGAFGECPGQNAANYYLGECASELIDPEGQAWAFPAFSPKELLCNGDIAQVPAIVVRPAPSQVPKGTPYTPEERAATRQLLHAAADFARKQHLKTHYRVYSFTNGAISFDPAYATPADSGLGVGLPPTDSSMFIWWSLKNTPGITLEGTSTELYKPLFGEEPKNESRDGAEIRDGSTRETDGLYVYTEGERLAGLEEMRSQAIRRGWEGLIDSSPILSDFELIEEAADQLANCFAVDDCRPVPAVGGDPSADLWKSPGTGFTISPQNFLFWDAPFYGDFEDMQFVSGTYMPIYQYAAGDASSVGNVHVSVREKDTGTVVEGAVVTLAGQDGKTDKSGGVDFVAVPAGGQMAEATFSTEFGSARVDVTAGSMTFAEILVSKDPPLTRLHLLRSS